jgi:hypothetical protein
MGELSASWAQPSTEYRGTVRNIRSLSRYGIAARALWPNKTAAELAFRAKVSERAAKFWLSGDRKPSARAIAIIVNEILD